MMSGGIHVISSGTPLNAQPGPCERRLRQDTLLAGGDLVVDRVVARLPHLGLEVQIDQLTLLRGPLAVRVPVVDQLIASSITDLDCGVGQGTAGAPLDVVAG